MTEKELDLSRRPPLLRSFLLSPARHSSAVAEAKHARTVQTGNRQMKQIASISISGRRWFQRSAGNTYCSANVLITFRDGTTETIHVPKQYGYGDFYLQAATDALERAGFMPGREHAANGSAEPAWRYFRDDRNIPFLYSAVDVPRERDL